MDDLTQLDGIGPKRAEALADVAITTFDLLAAMAPADIAGYLGIAAATAANVIARAAELAGTESEATAVALTAVSEPSVGAPTLPEAGRGIYLLTGRYRG